MHCTKISAEFEFGDHTPWVHTPKNVELGYDVGKISAGCLVQLHNVQQEYYVITINTAAV